jgi:glycerol-3-phosphate dehydrogenase
MAEERRLNAAQRLDDLRSMASRELDVLVIGGGITGAGVALDAATRGYRVGLVDKRDFASGTSSWSTKLIHGGIRYLPEGDVPLVREALVERGRLLANAPHLVRPRGFVLPLYGSSRHPVGLPIAPPGGVGLHAILALGLALYDGLAGRHNVARHRRLSSAQVGELAPCLRPADLRSGFVYYDAQTDDARLTLSILRSAATAGALVANHAEVVGFENDGTGRVRAAEVRMAGPGERDAGRVLTIAARHFVNATGVHAEQVEALTGVTPRLDIQPSKGVHVVFPREAFDLADDAVVLPETEDRRIVFILPWRSSVLVGTTDTGSGDVDHPRADDEDVDYLLHCLNRGLRRPVSRADALCTFAGYRPLLRLRHARTPARLSRAHAVVRGSSGMLSVSGGKLTTYRVMARDVVDRIGKADGESRPCRTADLPLAGTRGWNPAALELRTRVLGLDPAVAAHLNADYGSLGLEVLDLVAENAALGRRLYEELPTIEAEALYVVRAELGLTVEDVVARRLRLDLESRDHGVAAAIRAGAILADEYGWSADERAREVTCYTAYAEQREAGLRRTTLPLDEPSDVDAPERA